MKILAWRRFTWGTLILEFKPQDLWVGAFWRRRIDETDVWICIVPCVPVHIVVGGMRLAKKQEG